MCNGLNVYTRYLEKVCQLTISPIVGGSVAEWLACWTQTQKGPGSNSSRDAVGNSLRQTVHTHCASVHQAAKFFFLFATGYAFWCNKDFQLVAALLRVARVTAGLAESNCSLPPGL